jgi:hypothetical protein
MRWTVFAAGLLAAVLVAGPLPAAAGSANKTVPRGNKAMLNPQPLQPGAISGFNPQPDPPGRAAGMTGMSGFQTRAPDAEKSTAAESGRGHGGRERCRGVKQLHGRLPS